MSDAVADVVLVDVSDNVATITLNRGPARNALNRALKAELTRAFVAADSDPDVRVIILTGADPAFCAGLDLKELGDASSGLLDAAGADGGVQPDGTTGPFPAVSKPVIGAINGVAVTGGFELALHCDFLIASDRARFGDTHARVGVMPGWGLTVLLPRIIGIRRAREMSFTGNFMTADEALQWGLVNHVVPHEELLPFCRKLAADIVSNNADGVSAIRETYRQIESSDTIEHWAIESSNAKSWRAREFSADEVAKRRAGIMERGRNQN
ncbi:MAG: enoyl-CoA hydratase [Acidimicrobiia bacterium]